MCTQSLPPLPTFGGIIFVVFSIVIFLNHDFLLYEGDTAWIIRTGEYIIDTHTIPSHDLYSYTHPESPWVVYQWGFEVLIAGAYKIAGFHGAAWVCSIIIASTLLLFFKLLRMMGTTSLVAFPLTLLAGTVAPLDWDMRPGIVSQLLFVATLYTLQDFKLTKKPWVLYRLPLIFLIWANTHLWFVLGLMAIGSIILERCFVLISVKEAVSRAQERRSIVLLTTFLAISLLVTLLNPNGPRLITYLFDVANLEMYGYIMETQSADFHSSGLITYQGILIILIISLTFLQQRTALGMLFMAIVFLIMSLHTIRFSPYFAFLSSIVIAQQLNPHMVAVQGRTVVAKLYRQSLKFDERERVFGSSIYTLAVALIITIGVISGYTQRMLDTGFSKEKFPVEACDFVKQHELPGNLYSSGYWGSYAIFSLYPRYKVFIDTRFDMYGDKFFFEWFACSLRITKEVKSLDIDFEEPNLIFDKYQVNWILIKKEKPLAYVLKGDKGWIRIYSDDIATIFLRNNEANRVWLQQNLGTGFAM